MEKTYFESTVTNKKRAQERFTQFRKIWKRSFRGLGLTQDEEAIIFALSGKAGHADSLLWSDMRARAKASNTLLKIMSDHWASHKDELLNYYFVTLIDDSGVTSDRFPEARIKHLKEKAVRSLRDTPFDAIAMVEKHPVMNYPRKGKGRTLLYHIHAVAWTKSNIDPVDLAKDITEKGSWSCSFNAAPVNIEPISSLDSLERCTLYMTKPPHSAKNWMPKNGKPGVSIFMDTIKGYRPDLAMRVFEGLTTVKLMDVILSIKGGREIRNRLKTKLVDWHRKRPTDEMIVPKNFDVWQMWHDIRARKVGNLFAPYRFDGCRVEFGTVALPVVKIAAPRAKAQRKRESMRDRQRSILPVRAKKRMEARSKLVRKPLMRKKSRLKL